MELKLRFWQQVRIIKISTKNHYKKFNPILKLGMDQMILMWYQIIQHFLTSLVYLCGMIRKCVPYDMVHIIWTISISIFVRFLTCVNRMIWLQPNTSIDWNSFKRQNWEKSKIRLGLVRKYQEWNIYFFQNHDLGFTYL